MKITGTTEEGWTQNLALEDLIQHLEIGLEKKCAKIQAPV